jgi:signal transduction histidine kinase/CheY-like chemotaxis protein/HPt (histidine-containing phosphotransfer) domain-containing protein
MLSSRYENGPAERRAKAESDNQRHSMRGQQAINHRADTLLHKQQQTIYRRTDRMFAGLMTFQWLVAIIAALVISPRTWAGTTSQVHFHVWAAVIFGGLLTLFPVFLVLTRPGALITRYVISIAQMLTSALLIHLSGGRIETHFHVFGSLAFLAFYRDWRVFIPATIVVAADHFFRGMFWPQSVFGALTASPWRWVEHAGWVIFENIFLVKACLQGVKDMRLSALQQAELEAAKHDADAANRAKSEFLANMSHEIRTPLNGIIGITEMLLDKEVTPQRLREYVSMVKESSDALLVVINDILDFSKIEAGKLEIDSRSFKLRASLHETIKPYRFRAGQKGLEVSCNVEPEVPDSLIGDPGRLRQVIINLMANAIKFTESGEVSLRVALFSSEDKNIGLHFAITDTGIGIPSEKLTLIFDPFTQADGSMSRKYGGTGLGLSITSRLVSALGGRIWVESELGKGSTFHFTTTLCIQKDEVAGHSFLDSAPLAATAAKVSKPNLRVLLAEDNHVNQAFASYLLEKGGHTVVVANNGTMVLNALGAQQFDLILMDLQMPEMDGFATTAAIRTQEFETGRHIPIIAVTAHALKGDRERCLSAGMDGYVSKPIRNESLLSEINRVIIDTNSIWNVPIPAQDWQSKIHHDTEYCFPTTVSGDPELCAVLARAFLEEAGALMLEIQTSIQVGDGRALNQAAHALKGAAQTLDATSTSQTALVLEMMGRDHDFERAGIVLKHLHNDLERLFGALRVYLKTLENGNGSGTKHKTTSAGT